MSSQCTNNYSIRTKLPLDQNHIAPQPNQLDFANNNERMGKELWTEGDRGRALSMCTAAYNELDESRFTVSKIKAWQEQGGKLDECGYFISQ